MEPALAFEMPAVGVRGRLGGFVLEVAERLPLRRQRENALLYVRGLIEQGGRKNDRAAERPDRDWRVAPLPVRRTLWWTS